MNPTLLGTFSVLWWGMAIPLSRIFQTEIGMLAYNGLAFTIMVILGFSYQKYRKTVWDKAIFKNKYFYLRGLFMLLHVACFSFAALMVQKEYIPIVILLNYFWPSAVILYSIWISGVQVTRWLYFIVGMLVILAALTIELVGSLVFEKLDFQPLDYICFVVVFFGANCWGVFSALSRKYGDVSGTSTVIPFYHAIFALLLPFTLIFTPESFATTSTPFMIPIMILCSFGGFLAYLSWDFGMRKGSVVVLSLLADFIPWLSLFFAHILLGVEIGNKTILSAVLLVSGAMVARYGTLPKKIV